MVRGELFQSQSTSHEQKVIHQGSFELHRHCCIQAQTQPPDDDPDSCTFLELYLPCTVSRRVSLLPQDEAVFSQELFEGQLWRLLESSSLLSFSLIISQCEVLLDNHNINPLRYLHLSHHAEFISNHAKRM